MWTEAHRAGHKAGLKEMVSTCAVEEMARWLERADREHAEFRGAEAIGLGCGFTGQG